MVRFKQLFIHFTKNKRVYEKYMFYMLKYNLFIFKENPFIAISHFDTKEKYKYWNELALEWRKYVNEKYYIPLFIKFLKHNYLYDKYLYRVLYIGESSIEEYVKIKPPRLFIKVFDSERVDCFWFEQSQKWNEFLASLLNHENKVYTLPETK